MHIQAVSRSESRPDQPVGLNQQASSTGSDAFDGSAEPIVYMSENRVPVVVELGNLVVYVLFSALLLALLFILPGVRRKKLASFLGLVTLLLAGASILLSLTGSYWLSGGLQLHEVPYGALTSKTITGELEVNIGLSYTNVTLIGRLMGGGGDGSDGDEQGNKQVNYNERFHWDRPDRMQSEHNGALKRGLPYPILTITEFLSQDSEGFNWMRRLRHAGYYTSIALHAALVSWCLTMIVMCLLPTYLPHMMQTTGALMVLSAWVYSVLVNSSNRFVIHVGRAPLALTFGRTYMIALVAGVLLMLSGAVMLILQMNTPHDQSTIMDCDSYLKDQKALYPAEEKKPINVKRPHRQDSMVIKIPGST